MKLTMHYMEFYPMQELHLIGQMLNSSKSYSALLSDMAENSSAEAIGSETTDEQQSSDTEDVFVYNDFLSEVNQLAAQMTVLALHSLGEKTLRKLLSSVGKTPGVKFKEIEQAFLDVKIDLKAVDHYGTFTEVRYVSNSIKHSGVVSSELASYNGAIYSHRKLGQPINIESSTLELYFIRNKSFLSNICQRAGNDA